MLKDWKYAKMHSIKGCVIYVARQKEDGRWMVIDNAMNVVNKANFEMMSFGGGDKCRFVEIQEAEFTSYLDMWKERVITEFIARKERRYNLALGK